MLLITDLDGTLLDDEKNITSTDLDAIKRWQAAGHLFTFATGRAICTSRPFADILKPALPAIVFNGAVIHDFGSSNTVSATPLPTFAPDVIRFVLDNFPHVGITVQTIESVLTLRRNDIVDDLLEVERLAYIPIIFYEIPRQLFKVLFGVSHDRISKLNAALKERWDDRADFVHSNIDYFEMLPLGCCKGNAMKKLTAYLGYTGKIAAIGDFDNDITMLKNADFSACPSCATKNVRDAVQTILKSDNGRAIAEFVDILMEEENHAGKIN